MARIPKRLQHTSYDKRDHSSGEDHKAGVAATIRSHDFRFRDERTVEGLGLERKQQKKMSQVKKLVSRKNDAR
ncbi:MAG TPA: hypothetical protein VKK79_07035 [Candidatus Lokiarchaeia archaeon]|nr:hypothetical protein [Candidatus Lokiarchaeia archaeon]